MAGNSDVYHFDAQKYAHASTQWHNDMPTNFPKFYPFKISSILRKLLIFLVVDLIFVKAIDQWNHMVHLRGPWFLFLLIRENP